MKQFKTKFDLEKVDDNCYDLRIIDSWYIEPKSKWKLFINKINNFKLNLSWVEMYTWCDISGYEYWLKNYHIDQNYVILTIKQKKDATDFRNKKLEYLIDKIKYNFEKRLDSLNV